MYRKLFAKILIILFFGAGEKIRTLNFNHGNVFIEAPSTIKILNL